MILASGAGSHYERLDDSVEALSGQAESYQILELSFDGPGDATPWFTVDEDSRGG